MNKAQITWALSIVGGLLALGTTGKTFWNDWGWITPATAQQAHEEIERGHVASEEGLKQGLQDFRDEWKCDEYDEELRSLKRQLARTEPGTDEYADLEYDIARIENKMSKINCSRFEDFG